MNQTTKEQCPIPHSYDALTFGVYTEGTDGIFIPGSEADGYDALGFT